MPTQGSGRPGRTLSHSSIAQSVEHAAVNRRVVGSNPTGGARDIAVTCVAAFFEHGPLAQLVRATGS